MAQAAIDSLRQQLDYYANGVVPTVRMSLQEALEAFDDLRYLLIQAQGCRTCDMCPFCGHKAHGPVAEIGHYPDCELGEALGDSERN